jgi:hypothetical protein
MSIIFPSFRKKERREKVEGGSERHYIGVGVLKAIPSV